MRELSTPLEVMDELGGTQCVADLTGRKYTAAFNWRTQDTFPANTYLTLTAALERKGCTADPKLWGMRQPEPAPNQAVAG